MSFINFEGTDFTLITDKNNNPWMIGKELCDYLEIKNTTSAIRTVPEEDKQHMVFDELKSRGHGRGGDNGKRILISEPGIYMLIMKSRKPEAKKFKHWLYHDVLPTIRKTGSYSIQPRIEAPKAPPQQIPRAPKTYKEAVHTFLFKSRKTRNLSL
jgi:anti-repressor protein